MNDFFINIMILTKPTAYLALCVTFQLLWTPIDGL